MSEKTYLDSEGVRTILEAVKRLFVRKDGDKVLSDVNFSFADKAKLDSLQHTLTFGAEQQYQYDGTEDVTVPVYQGEYT